MTKDNQPQQPNTQPDSRPDEGGNGTVQGLG